MVNAYAVRTLLQTDTEFMCKCMRKLYQMQTHDEQVVGETLEVNNAGFNKADANALSVCVAMMKLGIPLTLSELQGARRRMNKYATQLSNILNEEDLYAKE